MTYIVPQIKVLRPKLCCGHYETSRCNVFSDLGVNIWDYICLLGAVDTLTGDKKLDDGEHRKCMDGMTNA